MLDKIFSLKVTYIEVAIYDVNMFTELNHSSNTK